MNQQVHFFLYFFSIVIMFSCSSYKRQDGCTLDKLHINGKVKKIGVTSLTTVPLTEMFADTYNSEDALPIFSSNFNMDFDNTGHIKKKSGFGFDGKELFCICKFRTSKQAYFMPVFFGAKEIEGINDLKVIRDENSYIYKVNYLQGKGLLWIVEMKYNEKGDVVQITKKNCRLNVISLRLLNFRDTMIICYHDFDEYRNWTKVDIQYRGLLKKHNFEYTAVRSITYDTDANSPSVLFNFQQSLSCVQKLESCGFIKEYTPIFTVEIPNFMSKFSFANMKEMQYFSPVSISIPLNYLFMFEHKEKNSSFLAMITLSDAINYDELSGIDLIYNVETDKILEDALRNQTAQKWNCLTKMVAIQNYQTWWKEMFKS